MLTGECPSSTYAIKTSFNTHYDCVLNGYAVAQNTFKELKKMEDFERDVIEQQQLVVKFECKPINIIVPKPKPKVPA
tara:strand:+ start:72 stop:302 length:231 start_codon:yes stop_codon:yes gene_type:complete